ncbi:hypothetical protein LINPERHAP2_LOCUS35061, partial [Linum perenne]
MNAALGTMREKVNGDAYLMDLVIQGTNALALQLGDGATSTNIRTPSTQAMPMNMKKRTNTYRPKKRPVSQ